MTSLFARVDLLSLPQHAGRRCVFRGRDRYSLSDERPCLRLEPGGQWSFALDLPMAAPPRGPGLLSFAAMPEILDSAAYTGKFLNSAMRIAVNGQVIHDGLIHWRSHEETAAYWPVFDFDLELATLHPGRNEITLTNLTTGQALGEHLDPRLLQHFSPEQALAKLATIYLSDLEIHQSPAPPARPALVGLPAVAVAGAELIVEIAQGPAAAPAVLLHCENAVVTALGQARELGELRSLFTWTPQQAGAPSRALFQSGGVELRGEIPTIYARRGDLDLIAGPGMETVYWRDVKRCVRDVFELSTGNCVRFSFDDFLNDLHGTKVADWQPIIAYLIRRRQHFALQRLRVPPYSRMAQADLKQLADLSPELFAGFSVPEPILHLTRAADGRPGENLADYLAFFAKRVAESRLPGHKLVTFDAAGGLCGHYYRLGLDVHLTETGPSCDCYEHACARGGARRWNKPWGVVAAMLWYYGQGAQYACDDARVRLAGMIMHSAYLAGARQILWEGGMFDQWPAYNWILTKESWRDFYRRYDHPTMIQLRGCFRDLVGFHRAQQLPPPRVHFAVLQGENDTFHGLYRSRISALGDMSINRAWTLLKVFLPHFSFGRDIVDHGRPHRRWFSGTPYGQVDIAPGDSPAEHLGQYRLLALLGWNTMTADLYHRLTQYVENGGIVLAALPHFTSDLAQKLEWQFHAGGDLSQLCGVSVSGLGGRLETVEFSSDLFAGHLPQRYELTVKNPLFFEDFDETYPVFREDTTYFTGALKLRGAEVLATSQQGEPVVLRHRVGKGQVYLINSWFHCGRGTLLPLAEGILRTLVEQQDVGLRIEDPSQLVAWYEYPLGDKRRYFLLNTDWTREGAPQCVRAFLGASQITLTLYPGKPVQLVSNGQTHLLIREPSVQLLDWQGEEGKQRITLTGPDALRHVHICGQAKGVEVRLA